MQQNWIGRSDGVQATFPLVDAERARTRASIEIFTTRIDTIYGATFVLLAPEHPLVDAFASESADPAAFRARLDAVPRAGSPGAHVRRGREGRLRHRARRRSTRSRASACPIWVANFVLADYGTGAIMAVPAHDQRDFEFATKYGLPIAPSWQPKDGERSTRRPSIPRR